MTRWEVENTIDELKTHLLGRKTHVRAQKPREVVQEVYAWLLGHWSVRVLMLDDVIASVCNQLDLILGASPIAKTNKKGDRSARSFRE